MLLVLLYLLVSAAEGYFVLEESIKFFVGGLVLFDIHLDLVALAILLLEVTRRTIADETSIDHDGYGVTEGLRLIHPVGSKHDRALLQVLEDLEETPPCHWVHSSSGLVQELQGWTSH